MTDTAFTTAPPAADLAIRPLLRDTWALYKRLFPRSFGMGLLVFGVIELFRAIFAAGGSGASSVGLLFFGLVLTLVGTPLVQGALAESVRDVHEGAEPASFALAYRRAAQRVGSLVGVSILSSLGIGIGFVLLLVPGAILATRWALAVPIVMFEGAGPRLALRRSRALVAGRGWAVFAVLLNVWVRVACVGFVFGLASGSIFGTTGFVRFWVAGTVSSALTAPYAAHALAVLYYRLTDPGRPLVAEAPRRWDSIWDEQERNPAS